MAILLYSSGTGEIGTDVLAYDENLQSFVDEFILPTADGTNGQFLTTNGSGVISFATPASPEIITTPSGTVYRFTQPTAPTTRVGGAALVDNDLWYDSSTGRQWIRRGIYWVSATLETTGAGLAGATTNASNNAFSSDFFFANSLHIESSSISPFFADRNQDITDHWDFNVGFTRTTGSGVNQSVQTLAADTQNGGLLLNTAYRFDSNLNSVVAIGGNTTQHIRCILTYTKTGSNTNRIGVSGTISYRRVYGA